MLLPINEVIVKKRFRREVTDLELLKKSLSQFGLLHPIVVDQNKVLVAGHRRLSAAKELGWTHIEARSLFMSSKKDRQALEIDENRVRWDFTEEELHKAIQTLNHTPWWQRFWNFITYLLPKLK